ncbi:MAG: carbohydrate ABC transporter permease [Clostridia bacterium]|nr:carbohydrate ABC transporter permease [Clostridia bacterium]
MNAKTGKRKNNRIRLTGWDYAFHSVNYFLYFVFTLLCLYPFYYIIINSLSDGTMVDLGRVLWYPVGFTLSNYRKMLALSNIYTSAVVSVLRTVIGTVCGVFATAYAAYFFSKPNMWRHKLWYRLVIITMYFSAGLIPGYMNIRSLGLLDSFAVYIIPGLISVYNMVLIKTYFESIPAALEESAQIDGAGVLRRFFWVALPLSVPILATITLFTAVGQWNSFTDTLLYITNGKLYTLQYILQMYFRQADILSKQLANGVMDSSIVENMVGSISTASIRLTITVIVTFPIMCVYPFVQRYFLKGIMIGAVKG